MERLQAAGVAAAPVHDVEGELSDPHYRARGLFAELREPEMGPVVSEAPPVRLSETSPGIRTPAPLMGEHTDEVLRGLGVSDDELAHLRAEGAI